MGILEREQKTVTSKGNDICVYEEFILHVQAKLYAAGRGVALRKRQSWANSDINVNNSVNQNSNRCQYLLVRRFPGVPF